MLWLTLSKGELGQQQQQEGGTPDIDFQFDFSQQSHDTFFSYLV